MFAATKRRNASAQQSPRRIENRHVIQTVRPAAAANRPHFPGVQAKMMVITARRKKGGLLTHALRDLKTHITPKREARSRSATLRWT